MGLGDATMTDIGFRRLVISRGRRDDGKFVILAAGGRTADGRWIEVQCPGATMEGAGEALVAAAARGDA